MENQESTFTEMTRGEARELLKYAKHNVLPYTEKRLPRKGYGPGNSYCNYCGEPVCYLMADIPVIAYVVGVSEAGRDYDTVVLEYPSSYPAGCPTQY